MKAAYRVFISLSVLLLCCAGTCYPRNYYFSRLTSDNGLSHNSIKCIAQDIYGFMWFGTKNGLNSYDGRTVRIIDCDDPVTGNGNHNISSLYAAPDGKLWVGTDKGVYIFDPVNEVFTEFTHRAAGGGAVTNWVSSIQADPEGNIWIVAPIEGAFRWDGQYLHHYFEGGVEGYDRAGAECLSILGNGQVWIGTSGAGLFRYYPGNDEFRQYTGDDSHSVEGENIFAICEYGNSLAVAIHEGQLKKFDLQNHTFSVIDVPQVHYTLLRDVQWFGGSELWVASQEGLFVIDELEGKTVHLTEESHNPYSLSDKACSVIYRDMEQGIWVGTMLGGVNYFVNGALNFDKYIPYDPDEGVLCKKIRGLAEAPDGKIWIGTEDEGVCVLDPATGETKTVSYPRAKRERMLNTLMVHIEGDELWYGLFKHGLGIFNLVTQRLEHITTDRLGMSEESIYCLYKDKSGNLWAGNAQMVYVKRAGGGSFEPFEPLGTPWVFDILEDSRGYLWFASMGTGLFRFDPDDGTCVRYLHDPADPSTLGSNSTNSLFEDSRGNLWVSTERGGLCMYDYERDKFVNYSIEQGLPDDVVYKVLEDSRGMLWFGTNRGLVEFDPRTESVEVYRREDGLPGNQFHYNAALKDRGGRLWFGGVDGLISFIPGQVRTMDYAPPVYITRLTVNNKVQTAGTVGSALSRSILFTDEIVLEHDNANIGLDFTAPRFSGRGDLSYYYYLGNFEQEWTPAGDSRRAYYSQLPPGDYTFLVKAVNKQDGSEQFATPLRIVIRPPWWQTGLAKFTYLLLACALAYTAFHISLRRRKKKMLEQQRLFETEKEKELYRSKVDFFNEIAHEIRTPLTLINGPIEDVMEINRDEKLDKSLRVISKNCKRLLDLTRQLLDFRNVDADKLRMVYTRADVIGIVSEIIERFEPALQKHGKKIIFDAHGNTLPAAVDKEALTKILSNLLTNAMKYCDSVIRVEVLGNGETLTVRVTSDGEKIPPHMAYKIFEPFFRLDTSRSAPGTGIGLSLSRSLAQLHKGRLYLDTASQEEGNIFVLTLPIDQQGAVQPNEPGGDSAGSLVPDPESGFETSSGNTYTVLVVEDNISILDYLSERLKEYCVVITATNGVEALEVLRSQNVDLIVSDIMMPDMDGMELCRRIKKDDTLRYTPVVFLTAKNDLHAKVEGLQNGAEAFVEKPFSFAYLKALIFSIMDNRRSEREAFAKRPFVPVGNIKMKKGDEEFIDKVIGFIHQNITSEKLSVEYLAEVMCMNRSSLLRKIKNITGLSAVDFISVIRLKEAAKMLREGRFRINEVCYAVGINSPSYFSKLFKQQFGVLPREFEKIAKTAKE